MSTDYEIRCSCGSSYSMDNWRDPNAIRHLIEMRGEFAAIHHKAAMVERGLWLYGWDAQSSMFPEIFRWCAEHEGHAMAVFDEYGKRWPREQS